MELHSNKLTFFLMWSVYFLWAMRAPIQVRGDAMTPETCSTQTSTQCQAMVGYVPTVNIHLSLIASLFSLKNYTFILGSNEIDPSLPDLSTLVVPKDKVYSIPQTCGCVSGRRVVTSATYTVVSGDTLTTIADVFYSHLVKYQEIAALASNNISNPDLILVGQELTIPIPCACFNQSDGTRPALFLSYQIQEGDSLSSIAGAYNTSATHLEALNSLNASTSLTAADILFVPRPVCKANFSSGALDGNLTVVEGTYELTAYGCVQCNCDNGSLHCIQAPSSLGSSCSNQTCPRSSLVLGASTASQGSQGCSVQSCVYMGYSKSGIMSRLENEQDSKCPIALPPETFYKPPTGLVASPLSTPTTPSSTSSSPPPPSTLAATPPSPTTNPSSATRVVGFFSWWWCLLATTLLL